MKRKLQHLGLVRENLYWPMVYATAIGQMLLICLISSPAWADPISPGYDLFETPAGSSYVDLTSLGIGVVQLQGYRPPVSALFNPPYNNSTVNDTDTIVQRLAGINPLPVGGSGVVPIELVALSLQSVAPVNIGGNFYDLRVLGGSLLTPSDPSPVGNMTINHMQTNGGTFNSFLPVHATLTFTQVGNPSNTFSQPFSDNFTSNGSIWSHTGRADDVHFAPFGSSGSFYGGVNPTTGQKVLTQEQSLLAAHGVLPAQLASDAVRVFDPGTGQSQDYPLPEDGSVQFLGPPNFQVPFNAPNQWILFKEPDGVTNSDRLSVRQGFLYFESDPLGALFNDLPPNPVVTIIEDGTWQPVSQYFQGQFGQNPQIFVLSDIGNGVDPGTITGDYNHNNVVDAADYVLWRKTLGQTGTGLPADGNGNHVIDPGDYGVWRANFGHTAGSGSGAAANAAVPEPAAIILALTGIATIVACRQTLALVSKRDRA